MENIYRSSGWCPRVHAQFSSGVNERLNIPRHLYIINSDDNDFVFQFQNAPELVNEDIVRRITAPLEGAMMLLGQAPTLLKSYASELRALVAMLRLRLFEVLALLPPVSLESNFAALLRLLVSKSVFFYSALQSKTSLGVL